MDKKMNTAIFSKFMSTWSRTPLCNTVALDSREAAIVNSFTDSKSSRINCFGLQNHLAFLSQARLVTKIGNMILRCILAVSVTAFFLIAGTTSICVPQHPHAPLEFAPFESVVVNDRPGCNEIVQPQRSRSRSQPRARRQPRAVSHPRTGRNCILASADDPDCAVSAPRTAVPIYVKPTPSPPPGGKAAMRRYSCKICRRKRRRCPMSCKRYIIRHVWAAVALFKRSQLTEGRPVYSQDFFAVHSFRRASE